MRIFQNSQKQITNFVGLLFHATRFRSWISWLFIFWVGSTLFALPTLNTFFISISFCAITASGFVINQYFDKDIDRLNPQKRVLPMAFKSAFPSASEIGIGFFISSNRIFDVLSLVADLTYWWVLMDGSWDGRWAFRCSLGNGRLEAACLLAKK